MLVGYSYSYSQSVSALVFYKDTLINKFYLFQYGWLGGGAMLVASQLITPINETIYTTAIILESVGLSPLLLATLGFLRTV